MADNSEVFATLQGFSSISIPSGCDVMAHSKTLKKIAMTCITGKGHDDVGYDLAIVSTDGGKTKTIKNLGLDAYPKPFVYQAEGTLYLYFPASYKKPKIRQIDLARGTVFDRSINYSGEGEYTGAYLNPLAGCLVISASISTNPKTKMDILQVYDYDPLSKEPINATHSSKVYLKGADLSVAQVSPDNSHITCTKDENGSLTLYLNYGKWRDTRAGVQTQYLKKITATSNENLLESEDVFRFLQQKIKSHVYATNWSENYLTEIDVATGTAKKLGVTPTGRWYDYDAITRSGIIALPATVTHEFYNDFGRETKLFDLCIADVETGICQNQKQGIATTTGKWFSHISSGWAGEGLIIGTDRQIKTSSELGSHESYSIEAGMNYHWY